MPVNMSCKPFKILHSYFNTPNDKNKWPDILVPNFYYVETGSGESVSVVVLYETKNQMETICNIPPEICPPEFTIDYHISLMIMDIFKCAECFMCHFSRPMPDMSQSPIGNICFHCWEQLKPPIAWNPIPNLRQCLRKGITQ